MNLALEPTQAVCFLCSLISGLNFVGVVDSEVLLVDSTSLARSSFCDVCCYAK
jgi:hypothetical protein